MSGQLEKPQLRSLHKSQIKKNIIGALVISTAVMFAYKIFIVDRRKQRYVDFYKTYDPEKQLKIMNEAGLMSSYLPPQK